MEVAKILVVDDEIANLQKLQRTFVGRYRVLTASSGRQALELIQQNDDIAVIIADQRMPDMTGVDLFRQSLTRLPDAVRIILTGYTDVDVLMAAINSCKVFRYIVKPWDPPDLLMTVERGLESYRLAIENARFRRELIRRERLARELEIAREIQGYILPPRCPEISGYEVAVEYHPAREVGGDLYDFDWKEAEGSLHLVIGDVSGKSIPAALYGAVFSGQLRALFAQALSPGQILARANSSLVAHYKVNNYIAVACLQADLASGSCRFANSGMPFPYLLRGADVTRLAVSGVPLGLFEGSEYDEAPLQMDRGDLLVMASDGATDATDPDGQMFDEARFIEAIRHNSAAGAAQLAGSLYRTVCGFARNAEIQDDITILVVRRKS
ncbi:MAG: serine phosphatase RsbU, regulator of sigma subunit [Acidobacteria bacterium]|nr:serine phosphatase RsbU, regulator of sigma subunit [Acidobacteriota bacterium]